MTEINNLFTSNLNIKVTWHHKCKIPIKKNCYKWCNQQLKTKKKMTVKVLKRIWMTLIWTSIGSAFSNLIKPPKLSKFLKIFTNTFNSTTLKRFQAINAYSLSVLKIIILAIKFADHLLVVLDYLFRPQELNKAGDVKNATINCAMHACKL